jgi:HlyD family secretion protein
MKKNSWLVALVPVAAFSFAACTNASAGQARSLQGVVELDTVSLAFEVPGRIEKVEVDDGDRLQGKVVLAALDETMARPEREARAAELAAAKAQLALLEAGSRSEDIRGVQAEIASITAQEQVLERQRQRQVTLSQQGAAPASRLDEFDAQASAFAGRKSVLNEKLKGLRSGARRQEIDAARAQVDALAAVLLAADARLSRFVLTHEGTADVLDVHVKAGEVVSAGAPAFTLADLDHPYVDVFVPESEISAVKMGQAMWVRVDALEQPLRGQVERIGHQTEFTPRYIFSEKERANLVVRVRVRVNDPQHRLRAGVPAFVTPRLEER